METKICTKCNCSLPADIATFGNHNGNKDRLQYWCKQCRKEYRKLHRSNNTKYYTYNKEEISIKAKEYYAKNREYLLNKSKEYGKLHRKERNEYEKKNRQKFIECRKIRNNGHWVNPEYTKRYRQSDAYKSRMERTKVQRAEYKREYYLKNRDSQLLKSKENKDMINFKNRERYKTNKDATLVYAQRRRATIRNLECSLVRTQWKSIKLHFNNRCAYCGEEKKLEQEHFIPLIKGGEYTHNNIIPACKSCNCSKNNKNFFDWYPTYKYYSKLREQKILKFLNYNGTQQQLKLFI